MLNETQALIKIQELLDAAEVYKYEDVTHIDVDESGNETTTIDTTAEELLEADLILLSDEVKLSKMLDKMYVERYNEIAAKSFALYTEDELRIFYAECYYIAAAFLKQFALRYESEIFKRSYDYSTKTSTSEMSGKLYTANKYFEAADEFLKDIKFEKSTITTQARLARY